MFCSDTTKTAYSTLRRLQNNETGISRQTQYALNEGKVYSALHRSETVSII